MAPMVTCAEGDDKMAVMVLVGASPRVEVVSVIVDASEPVVAFPLVVVVEPVAT